MKKSILMGIVVFLAAALILASCATGGSADSAYDTPLTWEDFYGSWELEGGAYYDIFSETEYTHLDTLNNFGATPAKITGISPSRNKNRETKQDYPAGFVVQYVVQYSDGPSYWESSFFIHRDKESYVFVDRKRVYVYKKIDPAIAQAAMEKIQANNEQEQRQKQKKEQARIAALKQGTITLEGTATLFSTERLIGNAGRGNMLHNITVYEIDGEPVEPSSKTNAWVNPVAQYTVPAGTHNISYSVYIRDGGNGQRVGGVIRYTFAADGQYEIVANFSPDWMWGQSGTVSVAIQWKTK
jgi:hypothetical protein